MPTSTPPAIRRPHRGALLLAPLLALAACTSEEAEPLGLCPEPGRAVATAIEGPEILFEGEHAVGGAGDWLLANDRAAFVIQGVDRGISYYHYGGILVDAVPMDGCEQTAPDEFQEAGLILGQLSLDDMWSSSLRAFRATSIEVIADGRNGGPAILRARGVDDYYWLVEYTIVAEAYKAGDERPLSAPLGVEIVVDYILQPDSSVLEIDMQLVNQNDDTKRLMSGTILLYGNSTDSFRMTRGGIDLEGFSFGVEIPWLAAQNRRSPGGYAFAMADAKMASAYISGINAVFDLDQAISRPMRLNRKGDRAGTRYLLSVGAPDAHTAIAGLQSWATAMGNNAFELEPFSGSVVHAGSPVSGATVDLELAQGEIWQPVDRYVSGRDGRFGGERIFFRDQQFPARLVVRAPGRDTLTLAIDGTAATIEAPPAGAVRHEIRDEAGNVLPARLSFYRDGERRHRFFAYADGAVAVEPGDWEVAVSRGYEYEPVELVLSVPDNGEATLAATLAQVVDTNGFLSIDTHIHAGPSADSQVRIPERIAAAAADGLDVPVATDHEAIVGLQAGIDELGLHARVATITGEEVTATLPEHLTMFPVEPDGTLRGGIVEWYRKGLPELFVAMRERGAEIRMINHPGGLYDILEWNRVRGAPDIANYGALQMIDSTSPWSWDFEGIEVMNGFRSPMRQPGDRPSSGHFDNWLSFHNHGHRIVGVAVSDVHGYEDTGYPRTYFASPSEDLVNFDEQWAIDAFLQGRLVMSAGAFARISVDGAGLGELATVGGGVASLELEVQALPQIDVQRIRVYVNCDEVKQVTAPTPDAVVKFAGTITVPVDRDSYIVVAGFGDQRMPRGIVDYNPRNVPRFVTNPIYVDADGDGSWTAPGGKECSYTLD